ncbi:Ig-like domain-containing protein [Viridibacillus arvi]|uniref:Ig-like domain-containing protein n=1 Tax=Viridibacillus arvi TaxID=263475 RepID=UPI0034CD2A8F
MQSKKSTAQKLTAVALATPLALSSLVIPGIGGEAEAASQVPEKVKNATIDWDTFSHDQISLVWDDNPDATGYIVERNGEEVYRGSANRFDDKGLISGATYQYAIYAYNEHGVSVPSIDYVETDFVFQTIVLNWLPVDGAVEYLIERNGEILAGVDGDTFSYSDDTALLGNKYRYKVIPVDEEGNRGPEIEYPEIIPPGPGEGGGPGDGGPPVIIDPPNQAPTSSPIDEIVLNVDQSKIVMLDDYFYDPDGDKLTYSVTGSNEIAKADTSESRNNKLTVTGKALGDVKLRITASDGHGGTVQREVSVKVVESTVIDPPPNTNVPPIFLNIPNQRIHLGKSIELNLNNYTQDPDGDTIQYTAKVNNERVGLSVKDSTLKLDGLEKGKSAVQVSADDGNGHIVTQTFDVDVYIDEENGGEPVEPVDRPPVAGSIDNVVIEKGQTRNVLISGVLYDPDDDPVTYAIETKEQGIITTKTFKEGNNTYVAVKGAEVGQTTVTATVRDEKGNSATTSFVVKVEEKVEVPEEGNKAPVAKAIPDGEIVKGTTKRVLLNNYFTDPDGDTLTYTVGGPGNNLKHVKRSVEGQVLTLEGTSLGEAEIIVTANDGNGHKVSSTFKITVVPPPDGTPPDYDIQDVIYGPDYVELEWYPILGAAGYWIYLNGNLVHDQPENGSYFYHYRAEGLDPNVDNVLKLVPYDADGEAGGEESFPLDDFAKLATFIVEADVNKNEATIKWHNGELKPEAYNVVIKDADGNVVSTKEYNYPTATEHKVVIEKAGTYTASVAPKIDGKYLSGKAVEFEIENDYIPNHKPESVNGGLSNIRVTVGGEPFVTDLNEVYKDIDGDDLKYTLHLSSVNASAKIEGSKLTVTGNHVGTVTGTLTVDDGNGGVLTKTVLIYVEKAANKPPVAKDIPDQVMNITDEPIVLTGSEYFTDPEGEQLVVSVGNVSNNNVEVRTDGSRITIVPKKIGTTTVQVIATDVEGASVYKTFTVTVKDVAPKAPTNFTATATAYNEVKLSFNSVGNAKQYIIKRDGVEIARIASLSYVDKNLSAKTSYEYEVIAVNDHGESKPATASVETPDIPKVTNLKASVVDQAIKLTWDQLPGSDRYKVYRYIKLDDGSFKLDNYGQTITGTTFTDTGLKGSTVYKYEVQPFVNNKFVEEFGASVEAKTEEINLAPVAKDIPTQELKVTDNPLELDVSQYFTDPNGDKLTFEVKGVSNGNVAATVNGSVVTITPNKVGTAEITLLVKDPDGLSVEKKFTVKVKDVVPAPTTDLVLKVTTSNHVLIAFDSVPNAKEYIIKRNGVEITRVTNISYLDTKVAANTTYEYEVIASNDAGQSTGVKGSVTTEGLPTVQNVQVSAEGTTAKISWNGFEGSTRYKVQAYKKAANGEFVVDGFARSTSGETYNYDNLEIGAEYKFAIIPTVSGQYKEDNAGFSKVISIVGSSEGGDQSDVVKVQVALDGTKANVTIVPFVVNGETIDKYRIQIYVKNADGVYVKDGAAKAVSSFTNTYNVIAGKDYKFEVTPRVGFVYDTTRIGFAEISVPIEDNPTDNPNEGDDDLNPDEIEIKGVTAVADGTTVTVNWEASGNAKTYKLYRYKVLADGTYKLDSYGRRIDNLTTFVDKGLQPNTKYLYVIVPLINNRYATEKALGGLVTTGAAGEGNNEVAKVENVQAIQSGKIIDITWDDLVGATKYKVTISKLQTDGTWKSVTSPTASTNSYSYNNAIAGTKYKIEVVPLIGGKYDTTKGSSIEL